MQTRSSAQATLEEKAATGAPDPRVEFFSRMYGGAWITQGLAAAAELGIPDLLAVRPRSVQELAEQCAADAGSLFWLLRALAGVGVFARDGQGRFELTPLGELLRSDAPGSQHGLAIMMGAEFQQA